MLIAWWRSGSKASPGAGATSDSPLASAIRCSWRRVSSRPARSGSDSAAAARPASMLSNSGSRSESRRSLAKRRAVSSSRAMRLRWLSRSARSRNESARSWSISARSASTGSGAAAPSKSGVSLPASCASGVGLVIMAPASSAAICRTSSRYWGRLPFVQAFTSSGPPRAPARRPGPSGSPGRRPCARARSPRARPAADRRSHRAPSPATCPPAAPARFPRR